MNTNEIKKSLYREKPKATLMVADNKGLLYETALKDGQVVPFTVPYNDIGDGKFYSEMEAQLLIRWMNK